MARFKADPQKFPKQTQRTVVEYPDFAPLDLEPELLCSFRFMRSSKANIPLTKDEQNDLKTCERIIKDNRSAFLKVAVCLYRINKQRLYRATHCRLYDYVSDVWGFKKSRAYELMQVAEITNRIKLKMGKLPNIVEAEALLVLAGLSDEEMIKTIHRATDSQWGEVLTAANVRNASGKAGIPGTPEKTNNPKKIKDKQRKMKVWVKGLSGITKYLTVENTTKEFRNEIIKELHDITNALKILNHEDDRGSK